MIKVRQLAFAYPDGQTALKGVSFDIAAGERVGLIGPNGAGKSTLLLILAGLRGLPLPKGAVAIGDVELDSRTAPHIRRQLGLLFQDPNDQLFCATVNEDVAFGPRQLGVSHDEIQERVREALRSVGLPQAGGRLPQHLSDGEKKRVCLAGILACQPRALLFDEPTANLDPRGRREFVSLCQSLSQTLLIASHDLEMVLAICSRVLVLDEGKLIADGPAHEVLGNEPLMWAHGLEKPHSLFHRHPHGPVSQ